MTVTADNNARAAACTAVTASFAFGAGNICSIGISTCLGRNLAVRYLIFVFVIRGHDHSVRGVRVEITIFNTGAVGFENGY